MENYVLYLAQHIAAMLLYLADKWLYAGPILTGGGLLLLRWWLLRRKKRAAQTPANPPGLLYRTIRLVVIVAGVVAVVYIGQRVSIRLEPEALVIDVKDNPTAGDGRQPLKKVLQMLQHLQTRTQAKVERYRADIHERRQKLKVDQEDREQLAAIAKKLGDKMRSPAGRSIQWGDHVLSVEQARRFMDEIQKTMTALNRNIEQETRKIEIYHRYYKSLRQTAEALHERIMQLEFKSRAILIRREIEAMKRRLAELLAGTTERSARSLNHIAHLSEMFEKKIVALEQELQSCSMPSPERAAPSGAELRALVDKYISSLPPAK